MQKLNRPASGKRNVPATSGYDLFQALRRSVDCFRRARVPYALIGAWALGMWGKPRATLDIDFLVMVSEEGLERLGTRMARAAMIVDETWRESNPMLRRSQLRLQCQGVTVDLLRSRDAHDRQIFRRRRKKRVEGHYYWVIAPEDFVIQKLKVGRPRDFEDALTVLERCRGKLDRRYLLRWARRLGILKELDYLLNVPGEE